MTDSHLERYLQREDAAEEIRAYGYWLAATEGWERGEGAICADAALNAALVMVEKLEKAAFAFRELSRATRTLDQRRIAELEWECNRRTREVGGTYTVQMSQHARIAELEAHLGEVTEKWHGVIESEHGTARLNVELKAQLAAKDGELKIIKTALGLPVDSVVTSASAVYADYDGVISAKDAEIERLTTALATIATHIDGLQEGQSVKTWQRLGMAKTYALSTLEGDAAPMNRVEAEWSDHQGLVTHFEIFARYAQQQEGG